MSSTLGSFNSDLQGNQVCFRRPAFVPVGQGSVQAFRPPPALAVWPGEGSVSEGRADQSGEASDFTL